MRPRGISALAVGLSLFLGAASAGQDAPSPFKALGVQDAPSPFKTLPILEPPSAPRTSPLLEAPPAIKFAPMVEAPAASKSPRPQEAPVTIHSTPAPEANREQPARLRVTLMPNETLAQAIARAMRESGLLSRYWVNVQNQDGVIDLLGEVSDESQRAIVIRIARSAPGVVMVRDWLNVSMPNAVIQTQGPLLQPLPQPLPLPPPQPLPGGMGGPGGVRVPENLDGRLPEPAPIFQMPSGPNPGMQPPPLPPYAWPTYAPYNNYSRVAYPLAYPYEQWPFIGPMYPFPRVPLGWRSVTLSWEDGHWWFNRNPTGHDWWRVRYW